MRVIGGKWKSRKINILLKVSQNSIIRPTTDRVKENIFNILENLDNGNKILGARVLDVFCGTGAMGIEAISRGASFCHFIDKALVSKIITENNIKTFSCEGQTKFSLINVLELRNYDKEKFNIVFLDPPYKKNLAEKSIENLLKLGWINKNTLLILEKAKDELLKLDLISIDKRIYGNTEILFLKF